MLAVTIGLVLVNLISPGSSIKEETRRELMLAYEDNANAKMAVAAEQKDSGPLQALVDLVPSNIFSATTNNQNMLQVIFFAIFFGLIFFIQIVI